MSILLATDAQADEPSYEVSFRAVFHPSSGATAVTATFGNGAERLRSLRFRIDRDRISDFQTNASLAWEDEYAIVTDFRAGTTVSYRPAIDQLVHEPVTAIEKLRR